MLIHSVFFWLNSDLTNQQIDEFEQSLLHLITIRSVKKGYVGRPGSTSRPVIDRSYSFGLTVIFDGMADHDAYQIDPIHADFTKRNESKWHKVVIYDVETTQE